MHRYWETLIKPLLETLQPASVIEIGCAEGKNTQNLIRYCVSHGGVLHAIDPAPKFDPEEWQALYGERFRFHQTLSLNALARVPSADVVLLDGDHNWYTVFNELNLIYKQSVGNGQPFPVVMLHDVGWPYGRRDLYYNPELIPGAFLKPFAQKGMVPFSSDLVQSGGLNPNYNNALYENNLQNGVLTAVEDFQAEHPGVFSYVAVSGFNGFGLLYPKELASRNQLFARIVESLTSSELLNRLVDLVEGSRVESQIRALDNRSLVQKKNGEITQLQDKLLQMEELIGSERATWNTVRQGLEAELTHANDSRRALEELLANERDNWSTERKGLAQELTQAQEQLQRLEALIASERDDWNAERLGLEQELAEARTQLRELENHLVVEKQKWATQQRLFDQELAEVKVKLSQRDAELERVQQQHASTLKELDTTRENARSLEQARALEKERMAKLLSTAERELIGAREIVQQGQQDLGYVIDLVGKLESASTAIAESWRWKVGDTLVGVTTRLLGRPQAPMATEYVGKVVGRFNRWRDGYQKRLAARPSMEFPLREPLQVKATRPSERPQIRVLDPKQPIVYQLTPGETRNPVFTGPAEILRRKGWDFRFSTDLNEIRAAVAKADRPVVLHFHQVEPLYRHSDRAVSEKKVRELVSFLGDQHKSGVGLVHTLHNRRPHDGKDLELDLQVSKAISNWFDRIVVLGEGGRTVAESLVQGQRVRVIRHPHYIETYGSPISKREARAQLGIPEKDFVFLSLGDMKPYKGHSLIMQAFTNARLNNSRLMVVGGHAPSLDYVRDLEQQAEAGPRGRIRVVSKPVETEFMSAWLGAADAAVYGFGDMLVSGSVLLALSYGLPVIAPDVGCLSEYVQPSKNGFLYEPGQVQHLSEMMSVAASGGLPTAEAVMASVQNLDPEVLADQLGKVYLEAANERSIR